MKKINHREFVAVLAVALLLLPAAAGAGDNANAKIAIDFSWQTTGDQGIREIDNVGPDSVFTLEVRCDSVVNLGAFNFVISFNPNKLKVTFNENFEPNVWLNHRNGAAIERNMIIKLDPATLAPGAQKVVTADTTQGRVVVSYAVQSSKSNATNAPEGEGLLAQIEFKTEPTFTTSDTARLNLSNVTYVDFVSNPLGSEDNVLETKMGHAALNGIPLPVELVSFSAIYADGGVHLTWSTASETNNLGFEVQRCQDNIHFTKIAFVRGWDTTAESHHYEYINDEVQPGVYYYRLKQLDTDGTFSFSAPVQVQVFAPNRYELGQNFPNPFNPTTEISFQMKEKGRAQLTVYNLLGQKVARLVDGFLEVGTHRVEFNASGLPSGIYLYRLEVNGFSSTRRMVVLK